jgi:predicted RNase H-like HicB family nuclease
MSARLHEQDALRLKKLEEEVQDLKRRLADVHTAHLVVATLVPAPYEVIKEIPVWVRPEEDSYVASFVDANVNASGETVNDAVDNLKDMMAALLESLGSLPKGRLGKGPARQLAVLKAFIRKKS